MAFYTVKSEKDPIGGPLRVPGEMISTSGSPSPTGSPKEAEKRVRREIANCNERRRMQSINAGFQSLKLLLPHVDGEKLSKAAILQQTADYICRLEQEKTHLMSQVLNLRRVLVKYENSAPNGGSSNSSSGSGAGDSEPESPIPPKKRKRYDSMMDEGIGSPESFDDTRSTASVPLDSKKVIEENHREIMDLRAKLDRERHYRMVVEERNRTLESQLYPEKLKEITKKVKPEAGSPVVTAHAEELRRQEEAELHPPHPHHQPPPPQQPQHHHRELPHHREQPHHLEQQQHHVRLQEQKALLMQYPYVVPITTPAPIMTAATTTTPIMTSTSRQNLETIFQAIRHLEGERPTPGNTPVQTPSHTPTPDDEARKMRAGVDECDDILRRADERAERSVIRETDFRYKVEREYEERKVAEYAKGQGIKVELVHPLDKLTARPSIIVS